jgi:hypothetical protein
MMEGDRRKHTKPHANRKVRSKNGREKSKHVLIRGQGVFISFVAQIIQNLHFIYYLRPSLTGAHIVKKKL